MSEGGEERRAVRLLVIGRVQGVGFRDFVQREAAARELDGWVRNRRDGSVEAVIVGKAMDVDAMVAAVREGPPSARVVDVQVADHAGTYLPGFMVLPTD